VLSYAVVAAAAAAHPAKPRKRGVTHGRVAAAFRMVCSARRGFMRGTAGAHVRYYLCLASSILITILMALG
jgi:hypothetical protein